jgi:(1->4)-alpha-D-glucan 1-alpha-D-glucosylmutase
VLATLLRLRAASAWPDDAYTPLEVTGERAEHVVAYARGDAIVIVPRLVRTLSGETPPLGDVWGDTELFVGAASARTYREVLTDRAICVREGVRRAIPLSDIFAVLPVAVLGPLVVQQRKH